MPEIKEIYFESGTFPTDPHNFAKTCGKCVPTLGRITYGNPRGGFKDLEACGAAFEAFGTLIFKHTLLELWNKLWKNFSCANPDCVHKHACGNTPVFVRIAAVEHEPKKGVKRYLIRVVLAREIMCKKDPPPKGGNLTPDGDEVPQLPDENTPWKPADSPGAEPAEKSAEKPKKAAKPTEPPPKKAESSLPKTKQRIARTPRQSAARSKPKPRRSR